MSTEAAEPGTLLSCQIFQNDNPYNNLCRLFDQTYTGPRGAKELQPCFILAPTAAI